LHAGLAMKASASIDATKYFRIGPTPALFRDRPGRRCPSVEGPTKTTPDPKKAT
jgi:hypothetical protein